MYLQVWKRDSTIEDAIGTVIQRAEADGYKVLFVHAEVQTNLFAPQEDVLVVVEMERK